MSTSRQKILTHLKKTRSASAREIARALKLSAPNVRHHLSVLASDGRVEMTAINNREGKGRPEKMYSLSEAALGDNVSALAEAVLTVAGSSLKVEALAGHILDVESFAGLSMNRRLALLIEKLNEMHYQARWEAGAGGPRVLLGHCPYARVVAGHEMVCAIDAALMRLALNFEIEVVSKSDGGLRGRCPFIFQVLEIKRDG